MAIEKQVQRCFFFYQKKKNIKQKIIFFKFFAEMTVYKSYEQFFVVACRWPSTPCQYS